MSMMMQQMFPGFGLFIQLLLIIIIVGVVAWVISTGNLNRDSAEEILKKRLARGEIDKKTYEDLKKELKK